VDTIKISFDAEERNVTRAVISEQKCTDHARRKFKKEVVPAFMAWMRGDRDNQLVQTALGLLTPFSLTGHERLGIYDRLVHVRPLIFQAALTVKPGTFPTAKCVALFKGFADVTPKIEDRLGHTFPLARVRPWFAYLRKKFGGSSRH
jgi:hypothetical protein